MKKILEKLKEKINLILDTPEKKIGFAAIFLVVSFAAWYAIASLHVGVMSGDSSIRGILRAYLNSDKHFPWGFLILIQLIFLGCSYRMAMKSGIANDRNFNLSESNAYGNAKELKGAELRAVADVRPPEEALQTILGQEGKTGTKLVTVRENPNSNKNLAVLGPPGSGKTYCIVINYIIQAIRRRESVVTTDTKGDLWASTVEFARRNGYVVRRFDLKNPTMSDGWDALKELQGDDVRTITFVDTIMANTEEAGDKDVFKRQAQALLKALCLYVERHPAIPEQERTLGKMVDILCLGGNSIQERFAEARRIPALAPAVKAFSTIADASEKAFGNIITDLIGRLQIPQSTDVADLLSYDDIDLTLPGKKPCIYYVILPDTHSAMRFPSSLFFSCLFTDLVSVADSSPNQRLPVPVNIMFEEFANVGTIPNIDRVMGTARSRGISIALIIQQLTQLQNLYYRSWNAILSDCATQICIGCNDKETAEFLSWRTGETTTKVKTEQHDAMESIFRVGLRHSTGDGRRYLYTGNEIMKLKAGQCLVAFQREDVAVLNTYGYTQHPEYRLGHMPKASIHRRIPISDRGSRYIQYRKEMERVEAYEDWLSQGGDPWPDYRTPQKNQGPMSGVPAPEIRTYAEMEEDAMESAQITNAIPEHDAIYAAPKKEPVPVDPGKFGDSAWSQPDPGSGAVDLEPAIPDAPVPPAPKTPKARSTGAGSAVTVVITPLAPTSAAEENTSWQPQVAVPAAPERPQAPQESQSCRLVQEPQETGNVSPAPASSATATISEEQPPKPVVRTCNNPLQDTVASVQRQERKKQRQKAKQDSPQAATPPVPEKAPAEKQAGPAVKKDAAPKPKKTPSPVKAPGASNDQDSQKEEPDLTLLGMPNSRSSRSGRRG